jgi:hypothetical protein
MSAKYIELAEWEKLQEKVHHLERQVNLLMKMSNPTKVKREVIDWLNEEQKGLPYSYLDMIKNKAVSNGNLQALKKQGISVAIHSLWTSVFDPSSTECPLRCYDLAPTILYGYDGEKWIRMTPADFKMLVQVSEQWFLRAILAEYPNDSDTAPKLRKKIFESSTEHSKLRTKIANFVRRSLKSIKIYEFEP